MHLRGKMLIVCNFFGQKLFQKLLRLMILGRYTVVWNVSEKFCIKRLQLLGSCFLQCFSQWILHADWYRIEVVSAAVPDPTYHHSDDIRADRHEEREGHEVRDRDNLQPRPQRNCVHTRKGGSNSERT